MAIFPDFFHWAEEFGHFMIRSCHFLTYDLLPQKGILEKQYEIGFLLPTLSENALSLELIPITGMW